MEKKRILCYGDSNTWGYDPMKYDYDHGIFGRYPAEIRWPDRLAAMLGDEYLVMDDAANGRTTCFEDPTWPGRKATDHFYISIESHEPLDLVILMLGTNDVKDVFAAQPWVIGWGFERLVSYFCSAMPNCISKNCKLLIIAPPTIDAREDGTYFPGFSQASHDKGVELAKVYERMAKKYGVGFMNSQDFVKANTYDGIHLNEDGCRIFAEKVFEKVKEMIG